MGKEKKLFLGIFLISIPNNNYGQSSGLIEAKSVFWPGLLLHLLSQVYILVPGASSTCPGISSLFALAHSTL